MIQPMAAEYDANDWFDDLTKGGAVEKANPVYKIYIIYKFIKKGKDKQATLTDKRWDSINCARQMKACKKILKAYDDDPHKAAKAVYEIGEYLENAGLQWDCNTIFNKITDWEEGRLSK